MFIAESLGKTVDEVSGMSLNEYMLWKAYFKIKAELSKPKNKSGMRRF